MLLLWIQLEVNESSIMILFLCIRLQIKLTIENYDKKPFLRESTTQDQNLLDGNMRFETKQKLHYGDKKSATKQLLRYS